MKKLKTEVGDSGNDTTRFEVGSGINLVNTSINPGGNAIGTKSNWDFAGTVQSWEIIDTP